MRYLQNLIYINSNIHIDPSSSFDPILILYNNSGNQIGNTLDTGGNGDVEYHDYQFTYTGYIYAKVKGYSSSTGTFDFSCRKATVTAPTVITQAATNITQTTATLNKSVTAGSETITAQGFKYKKTSEGSWATSTNGSLTGLTANTQYQFYAYATTASGTTNGSTLTFTTNTTTITECTVNTSNGGTLTFMSYNLGADPNMTIPQQMAYTPTGETDATVYGDLYQWGRKTDGHEKRNSSIISTLSSSNIPGHSNFITNSNTPGDWRNPQNDNLWNATKTSYDPCPAGWRIPTSAEWESVINNNTWTWNSNGTKGYRVSPDGGNTYTLFLPAAGRRGNGNNKIAGFIYNVGLGDLDGGDYWSSRTDGEFAKSLWFGGYTSPRTTGARDRGDGLSCRCVKGEISTSGINDVVANQLKIFPNPVKEEIFIKSDLQIAKVEIYTLSGALLFSENNFNEKISVSSLSQGIYLLQVYTDKGIAVSKIVKE